MRKINLNLVCILIYFTALSLSYSVFAQPKNGTFNKQIRDVEKEIVSGKKQSQQLKQEADNLKRDISKAGRDRVALANTVQNLEMRLSKLESEIDSLKNIESEKRQLLKLRRKQGANVLMALQRLSKLPPAAVIAHPVGTDDLIRTAILLRSVVPQIEGQAKRLRKNLIALAATKKLIANSKSRLNRTGKIFSSKRATLDGLIRVKAAQHERALSKRREAALKIQALSSQAQSLRDLFVNIEEERKNSRIKKSVIEQEKWYNESRVKEQSVSRQNKKVGHQAPPVDLKPFALARGALRYPAVGRISGRYGEKILRGTTRKGLTIETRASAQVVSPHNGRVVFAGNFRGYGQLLIIDHGEGYHTLLAGMSRIDGIMGQYLVSGEPVGVMGTTTGRKESLYIELRKNSQPINPTPWLAQRNNT